MQQPNSSDCCCKKESIVVVKQHLCDMLSSSHNSRVIKVSCFKYEDGEDEQGQVVVMYVILVENTAKNVKHILHKRYSDFLELFSILRDLSAEIDDFRFPNKSFFNNRSQFTLERRLEGFNDFLQLAIKMKPVNEATVQFLGLNALLEDSNEASRILNRRKMSESNININRNDDNREFPVNQRTFLDENANVPSLRREISTSSKYNNGIHHSIPNLNQMSTQLKNDEEHSYGATSSISCENYAAENVSKNLSSIGYFSFFSAASLYICGVLFGIIDISNTTKGAIHHSAVHKTPSVFVDDRSIDRFWALLLRIHLTQANLYLIVSLLISVTLPHHILLYTTLRNLIFILLSLFPQLFLLLIACYYSPTSYSPLISFLLPPSLSFSHLHSLLHFFIP